MTSRYIFLEIWSGVHEGKVWFLVDMQASKLSGFHGARCNYMYAAQANVVIESKNWTGTRTGLDWDWMDST